MSRWSLAKLLELIIAGICLFLHEPYWKDKENVNLLCTATFAVYTIALLVLLVGYFISKPFNRRFDILFGIIAIPLFLVCGYFILTTVDDFGKTASRLINGSTRDKELAKGWLSVANGVIFILDIVFHCFE